MEQYIWRYMPIYKFEELLKTQCLRFSPIRDFNDRNDGQISDQLWNNYFKLILPILGGEERIIQTIENYMQKLLDSSFASCWTIRPQLNSYMWQNYTDNNGGIAIKVNFAKLCKHMESLSVKIIHRRVKYEKIQHSIKERLYTLHDLLTEKELAQTAIATKHSLKSKPDLIHYLTNYNYLFIKREEFAKEQEYRFVISPQQTETLDNWIKKINQLGVEYGTCMALGKYYIPDQSGYLEIHNTPLPKPKSIDFPFNDLVEEIHLSPHTSFFMAQKVFSLMTEFNIPFDNLHWKNSLKMRISKI